ncbi:MAG: helix-turn-helix domain-containing protein [Lachnospiraceae bacterium]|nr:helix-turn-helix domain-containing protein [Lachnospiraceae bacterium]
MEIKDIIYSRRIELGLTMKQVAEAVGVSEGTISRWESGDIANMRRDKIAALAKTLHLSPAVIMGWEEKGEAGSRRIPVYGRVAAGIPMEQIEDITDWEEIPDHWAGEYMALRVKGDSMLPRIADGDVIIAHLQDDAESGDVVVAQVNGSDATVKKLIKHQNGITLQAYNPAYEPMVFSEEEQYTVPVRILGKVVELRGKF